MYKGFHHLHYTVVVLFLAFLTYKTILLLLNKTEFLDKLREKTKIADIILGSLILITGGYLLYKAPGAIESYLTIKIILVLAGIPLGIIGIKKKNKALAILSVLIFMYVWALAVKRDVNIFAGRKTEPTNQEQKEPENILDENKAMSLENAKVIYASQCALCHGQDGTLGVNGAKDLTKSQLSSKDKETIIVGGKGSMPPFGTKLTESEVKAVTAYIDSFKK